MANGTNWDRMTSEERRSELHRQMGTRPLVGHPLREAVRAEARAIGAELTGEELVDEVVARLDLEGWLSRETVAESAREVACG